METRLIQEEDLDPTQPFNEKINSHKNLHKLVYLVLILPPLALASCAPINNQTLATPNNPIEATLAAYQENPGDILNLNQPLTLNSPRSPETQYGLILTAINPEDGTASFTQTFQKKDDEASQQVPDKELPTTVPLSPHASPNSPLDFLIALDFKDDKVYYRIKKFSQEENAFPLYFEEGVPISLNSNSDDENLGHYIFINLEAHSIFEYQEEELVHIYPLSEDQPVSIELPPEPNSEPEAPNIPTIITFHVFGSGVYYTIRVKLPPSSL